MLLAQVEQEREEDVKGFWGKCNSFYPWATRRRLARGIDLLLKVLFSHDIGYYGNQRMVLGVADRTVVGSGNERSTK